MPNFSSRIVFFIMFLFAQASAQVVNDYRSSGNGDWDDSGTWEVYNGTAWVAATKYPGQDGTANDVYILGGDTVDLNTNIPGAFNSLTIGDGSGATDTLEISNTCSLNTLLVTIDDGGFVEFTKNRTWSLPAGAAVVIIPSGTLDTSNPCSAAKRIKIGTVIYSTCNGGAGAPYSFDDLNNGGGTLLVSPSSNSPLCIGTTLTLFANPSGVDSGSATFAWTGSGPGAYSFTSTLEDPTETGLLEGAYSFTVTATVGAITTSGTITVDVNAAGLAVSGGDLSYCTGGTVPTLSVTVAAGETADWYDAATGGTLLISGNTSYTPVAGGSFYVEARNTTTSCVSPSRTLLVLNESACKVITNRRITYRVKPSAP